MSSWERRLDAMVRHNVVTEIWSKIGETAIAVALDNRWMWLAWGAQWVVTAAVLLGRRLIGQARTDAALLALVVGHGIGAVGAVAALPELAPLVVIVVYGDLAMSIYATGRVLFRHVAVCLAAAAIVSALSLGSWSDLREASPPWLLLGFLTVHTMGTGWITARSSREVYLRLRADGEQLQRIAERLVRAERDEQLRLARRLALGTLDDLERMRRQIRLARSPERSSSWRARAAAHRAARAARRSLTQIRTVSHGLCPEMLHEAGLVAAIDAMEPGLGTSPVVIGAELDGRLPGQVESALFAVVSALAAAAPSPGPAPSVALRSREGWAELLFELTGPLDKATMTWVSDRVGSVQGDLDTVREGGRTWLHIAVPLAPGESRHPAAAAHRTRAVDGDVMLRRFVGGSVVLCTGGLLLTTLVWAVTGLAALGAVFGVLVIVLVSLLAGGAAVRRGRTGLALGLLCFETAFAGLTVTAVAPTFSPTSALIALLPVMLGAPRLSGRHLDVVGLVQTLSVTGIAVLGLADHGALGPAALPRWVEYTLLAPLTAAVGVLMLVVLSDGRAEIDAMTRRVQAALTALSTRSDAIRLQIERDLHDGAQQQLAALAIQCSAVATAEAPPAAHTLDLIGEQVETAQRDLELLVEGSFGAALRETGLPAAIGRVGRSCGAGVAVDLPESAIPDDVALAVYFSCHEAIQNATKHAGPGATIDVQIHGRDRVGRPGLEFVVVDDGVGCSERDLAAGRGLAGIRRRCERLGGELLTRSEPGGGTSLTGWIPVRPVIATPATSGRAAPPSAGSHSADR